MQPAIANHQTVDVSESYTLAACQFCILAAMLIQHKHCPSPVLLTYFMAICQLVAVSLRILSLTAKWRLPTLLCWLSSCSSQYAQNEPKTSHSLPVKSAWLQPLLDVGGLSLEGSGGAFKAPSPYGADPKPLPEGTIGVPLKLLLLV